MQNLIQSPALLSILKYPRANFDIPVESAEKRDPGVKSSVVPLNANASVFVPRSVAVKADVEEIAPEDLEQLKRHFESKDVKQQKTKLTLPWKGFPKRPDKAGNPTHVTVKINEDYAYEIKSGGKRAKRELAIAAEEKPPKAITEAAKSEATLASVDLTLEEKRLEHGRKVALEALKLVEQRRLRGPFVDPSSQAAESGEVIRHISHSPVRFTPEERVRVDKLRASKKERIERVLKEMMQNKKPPQQKAQKEKTCQVKYQDEPKFDQVTQHDNDQLQKDIQYEIFKLNKLNQALEQEMAQQQLQERPPPPQRMIQKRYFGLQRATAINPQEKTEMEAVDPKIEVKTELKPDVKAELKPELKTELKPELKSELKTELKPELEPELKPDLKPETVAIPPARRYIPTTKEWDEKCRTRQLERLKASDKENEKAKSNPNTTSNTNKPVLWRADSNRPLTVSNSSKNSPEIIRFENPDVAVVIPRYIPPIPSVEPAEFVLARLLQTEKRRGNLTYAQALLSRPPGQFEQLPEYYPVLDNIIRYTAEELLMLEPQPEQLQAPILRGTSTDLGFLFQ